MSKNPYPGTTLEKSRNRWKAQVRINGKTKSVGYYNTQQEAYAAVVEAKKQATAAKQVDQLAEVEESDYQLALRDNRKTTTVAQSNVLIEHPWAMTLLEARIFVLLLRGLRRDDSSSKRIVIPLTDLVGDQPIGGRGYQYLHVALDGLDAIRIDLPMPNRKKDYHKVPLVHSLKLDSGQGTISGYFSADVMPYLTNLTENFTLGQVADLLSIKNPNTHKFYWIMQMWKFKSPYTVAVETLRELTTGGAYPQFADYRKYVLKPSVEELNGLNFDISYTEKKKGRSVDSIEFHINYNGHSKLQPKQLQLQLSESTLPTHSSVSRELPTLTDFQSRVVGRMKKFKLDMHQIERILTLNEDDLKHLMKETHQLLKEYEAGTKVFDNIAATAMTRINQLYPRLYPKAK
ncbi:RepB family plasmid replication initiator protein [Hymenobacter sediminis]|uniref:RepB family plasmid replication initiator protein n=1 Tax=Hymenobacter sediminis TaxID=2218621 RepID=UPI000DA6905C|nr:RepB family plasmid replication initiator protein [Hymenobacter sediminis]RPD43738.1 RepB family plasmid replication initiator protein [Hymenobacter sediminis]